MESFGLTGLVHVLSRKADHDPPYLGLRGRHHPPVNRQAGQTCLHLPLAHLARVAFAIEKDVPLFIQWA